MRSKAERTAQYIVETVAPVFNKLGYIGASLSALTAATGLTKGAIYGNFKDKEELAIAAFNYNLRQVMGAIKRKVDQADSSYEKLRAIVHFYRKYHEFTIPFGGCPVLNVGIDANHQNPKLMHRVQDVVYKMQQGIADIINQGVKDKEFKLEIDPKLFARKIFSLFEGAVFMTMTMDDSQYLLDITDHIDEIIDRELKVV